MMEIEEMIEVMDAVIQTRMAAAEAAERKMNELSTVKNESPGETTAEIEAYGQRMAAYADAVDACAEAKRKYAEALEAKLGLDEAYSGLLQAYIVELKKKQETERKRKNL